MFNASIADLKEAGAFFLFLSISMCSFALLDFKEIDKIFLLTALVVVLFLNSYFGIIDSDVATPSDS